jgi:cytochrome b involved in lipid metabolism
MHFSSPPSSFLKGGPKVYDVTKYLDDHPGGAEVMLDVAGQNADEFFEDIGHSKEARNELAKYLIGNYKLTAEEMAKMKAEAEKKASEGGSSSLMFIVLVALIAIYVAYTQMSS